MYTDHKIFTLKRSRLAVAFLLLISILISVLMFKTLPLLFAIFILAIQIPFLYLSIKKMLPFSLYYLDQNEWTLYIGKHAQSQSVHMTKLVNHQLYIAIYLEERQHSPLIIWRDQLSFKEWKNLMVLAKLF